MSGQIETHNQSESSHQDIRTKVEAAAAAANTAGTDLASHVISSDAHSGVLEPAFTDAKDKTVSFSEASEKANISTGDKFSVITGKIAKWFSSFGSAAWKGVGTGADDVAAGNHTHSNYLTSETDPSVPSWAKEATKPRYSAYEVGADPTGTASGAVSSHNSAEDAHSGVLEKAFTDAKNKTVSFSAAASRENIATGETLGTIMGKLAKWFSSFGEAAWKGVGTDSDSVAAGNHTHSYIPASEKAAASGVASLDADTKVTASQASAAVVNVSASMTLASAHAGRFLSCTNASAITITIPTGIAAGTEIEIYRGGAGTVTLSAASGVTVECKESAYGIADQYTSVVLKWRATNVVVIEGNVG